jgi:Tripartite tricarboxylate transporter family receptor
LVAVGTEPASLSDAIVRSAYMQAASSRAPRPRTCRSCRRPDRPGASTIIGTEAVVRAPADGYTLLLVGTPSAINATLFEKLSYNFLRDIAPVAGIMRVPNVMVVHPSFPAKTVPRAYRLCQGQSGQDQSGIARRRNLDPHGRRTVQGHDRPAGGLVFRSKPDGERARVRNMSECWFRRIGDASRPCRA